MDAPGCDEPPIISVENLSSETTKRRRRRRDEDRPQRTNERTNGQQSRVINTDTVRQWPVNGRSDGSVTTHVSENKPRFASTKTEMVNKTQTTQMNENYASEIKIR